MKKPAHRPTNASKGLPKRKTKTFRLLPSVLEGLDTLSASTGVSAGRFIESAVVMELHRLNLRLEGEK